MAQSVIVMLVDDIDGGDADETIAFALDGKAYQIDLNKQNAASLRKALQPYIDNGRVAREATTGRRSSTTGSGTAFSQLDVDQKERFRAWAKMPHARRIADSKVNEWIKAGKP